MPYPTTQFGPIDTQTYTFLLGVSITMSMVVVTAAYRRHYVTSLGAVVDVLLAMFIGGLIVGRGFHVAMNRVYFEAHTDEITRIGAGGLDWHGAVIGALVVGYGMARLRRVRWSVLLNPLALMLPVIGFAAWWGCGANHCAYGAEVDNLSNYPSFLVWEARDIFNIVAPRYATQRFGMMWCAGLLILLLVLVRLDKRRTLSGVRRFALSTLLVALGTFWMGQLRGDYAVSHLGLREDQWLDLVFIGVSWVVLVLSFRRKTDGTGKDEEHRAEDGAVAA